MRRAASALARIVGERLGDGERILVIAGSGDNGGDALFAAALLAERAEVSVLRVSDRVHPEAFSAAESAGARVVDLAEARASAPGIVIDGIIGLGASADPALRGRARAAVEALLPRLRDEGTRVIAVDLPSGLHPDTGAADDVVLPAALTVTFGAVKHGLAAARGPELAGEIVLVRIGLDDQLAGVRPEGQATVSAVIEVGG
ncbi:NAD(P)H-hydrate epimerase [Leucobacter sp. CSA1]|uniref:NAD(P)H-hydrate epimerase n=2 Tax=Leucobacter chromiisoli TaxID=2796471 RepID=A0A934Q617_9MICO|nr:NAD(P)H-hydrate epimerase [Leucobacter chromiisoli]